jgi:plasmid stability protein
MPQLLVRNIEPRLVAKLKRRAAREGVSAEEAHRRILREVLNRPLPPKPSLIDYLLQAEIAPEVDIPLQRDRGIEVRDPGF